MPAPVFLTIEQVRDLHAECIASYGGQDGLRDAALLESAVMAPQQTFDGAFLYGSIAEMAAAYWFGLVGNHVFIDGNKRVGLFACDMFLLLNGYRLTLSPEEAIRVTVAIATRRIERNEVARVIAESIVPL